MRYGVIDSNEVKYWEFIALLLRTLYFIVAIRRKLRPDVIKKCLDVVTSHHICSIRHGEHSQKVSEHSEGSRRHFVVIVYVNEPGFPSFFTIKLRLLLNSQRTLFILQSYT